MFGSTTGTWGVMAPPTEDLLQKERPAPPKPIPIEFPNHQPELHNHALTDQHMKSLRKAIANVKRPQDIRGSILSHLNIDLTTDVPLIDFVPAEYQNRPFLYDADLTSMLEELSFDNEDAFREILRQAPLEGKKKPKLAYSRNFYTALEDMSHYYDDSKDEYIESTEPNANTSPLSTTAAQSSPTKSNPAEPHDTTRRITYRGHRLGNATHLPLSTRSSLLRSFLQSAIYKFHCRDHDSTPSPSTLSANSIGVVGTRDRLRVKDINIPSGIGGAYGFCVAMVPDVRELARKRCVVGPVLAGRVVGEVVWTGEEGRRRVLVEKVRSKRQGREGVVGDVDMEEEVRKMMVAGGGSEFVGDEEIDLCREVGGLVLLAVQRGREGRTKKDVEEEERGKWWWAREKRWGGGEVKWGMMAHEVLEEEDPSLSPQERRLRDEKREKEEKDKKREEELQRQARQVDVQDLLANASSDSGPGGSNKEKMDLAYEKIQHNLEDIGFHSSRDKDSNGPVAKKKRLDDRSRRKGAEEEMRDGKKVMYVPLIRKKWLKDWNEVRPNACAWDEKIIYKRIGKAGVEEETGEGDAKNGSTTKKVEDDYDEVFQLSCVNHHICLTKLRISDRYMRWLDTGETVQSEAGDDGVLKVWRSRYFNMFDKEERKEMLVGLWRVMGWVMRDEVPETVREQRRKEKGDE